MPRELTLRQIEGFKAVVDTGTISGAASKMYISQPAMSKLITHLEADAGISLFDRSKRRLTLTIHGKRFYEEIDRIFAGVRQVQKVADAIRREEQGQLTIGVMPALSGKFIQRTLSNFLSGQPKVFCSVQSHSSDHISDWLATRRLDVGLVNGRIENRYIVTEPFAEHPLVCIMPHGHPLESRKKIEPNDLDGQRFIAFNSDSYSGKLIGTLLETNKVETNTVLVANLATAVCEFVAAGHGVSLIHPLYVCGFENHLTIRRFVPETPYHFQICRSRESRNGELVQDFFDVARATANEACALMLETHFAKASSRIATSRTR